MLRMGWVAIKGFYEALQTLKVSSSLCIRICVLRMR